MYLFKNKKKHVFGVVFFINLFCYISVYSWVNAAPLHKPYIQFVASTFNKTYTLPVINKKNIHGLPIPVYHVKTTSIPSISLAVILPRLYHKHNTCIGDLSTQLIGKQFLGYDAEQTANSLADIGAEFSITQSKDYIQLSLRTLNSEQKKAIDWLNKALFSTQITQKLFDQEKQKWIQDIQESQKDAGYVANQWVIQQAHANHAYGYICDADSANKVMLKDVQAYYQQLFSVQHLNKTKLIIVGDIDAENLNTVLIPIFENNNNNKINSDINIPNENIPNEILPPVLTQTQGKITTKYMPDITQAHIKMAMSFIPRKHEDMFALTIANYVLGGGGFASHLMTELREKQGLVYGASSGFSPWQYSGLFTLEFHTKTEQTQKALDIAQNVLETFAKQGIKEQEFKQAQKFLLQSFASRLDTNEKWLNQLVTIGFYDLPLDYLQTWQNNFKQLSVQQVNQSIQKHFQFKNLNIITVTKK